MKGYKMPESKEETKTETKTTTATKKKTEESAQADTVLTKVLERLDKLESSNERLEADNKKLKTENKDLSEISKENAELKSRLDAMNKQLDSINVAEKLTQEQKRQIWEAMREERYNQIRASDDDKFHIHTAKDKPITTETIKKERKEAKAQREAAAQNKSE